MVNRKMENRDNSISNILRDLSLLGIALDSGNHLQGQRGFPRQLENLNSIRVPKTYSESSLIIHFRD